MNAMMRAALMAVTFLSAGMAKAEPLTLEEAIRRSVSGSPQETANAAQIETLEAARAAVDTRPAATIDGMGENIGTGGFSQFQVDATYNQRIERGGKREARVQLVEGEIGIRGA